jgi:hypothetical protein
MNISDCTHALYDPNGGHVSDLLHPVTGDPVWGKGTLAEALAADPALVRMTVDEAVTKCTERFWDALEVLPPCKWGHVEHFEVFHVSERITGNLVDWYASDGESYWHVVEASNIKPADLAACIRNAPTG